MMEIKNIIFDLGGVLIDWNPDYMYKKIIQEEGKRKWFLENVCTSDWNEAQDGGRSIHEANQILIEKFPEYQEWILAYYTRWEEMLNGSIQGTVDIFTSLKSQKNFGMYALTNWSAETFPRALELFDFLHWFDGRVVSGEEKTRKPFKEIYDIILSRFNLIPQETLFIDDNLRNIKAAESCGITSIHFQSPEQLRNELININILNQIKI
ncbi:MAG: HAD family hydrolase [Bacteroidota bacterium]|jgi:2-haloacid dehalogenase